MTEKQRLILSSLTGLVGGWPTWAGENVNETHNFRLLLGGPETEEQFQRIYDALPEKYKEFVDQYGN